MKDNLMKEKLNRVIKYIKIILLVLVIVLSINLALLIILSNQISS